MSQVNLVWKIAVPTSVAIASAREIGSTPWVSGLAFDRFLVLMTCRNTRAQKIEGCGTWKPAQWVTQHHVVHRDEHLNLIVLYLSAAQSESSRVGEHYVT